MLPCILLRWRWFEGFYHTALTRRPPSNRIPYRATGWGYSAVPSRCSMLRVVFLGLFNRFLGRRPRERGLGMAKSKLASYFAAALLVFLPQLASAQSSIAGIVRDPSGAIIPGVTVTASSPALIERSRTATTDGSGRYAIVDLRPGTYTVTATVAGFKTFKQEGIEVPSNTSVPLYVEMGIGSTLRWESAR
jgi:hypothetical protein